MMSQNRKDDHIKYALEQRPSYNSFDEMNWFTALALVRFGGDLSTHFAGRDWEFPFINAMTPAAQKGVDHWYLARAKESCSDWLLRRKGSLEKSF